MAVEEIPPQSKFSKRTRLIVFAIVCAAIFAITTYYHNREILDIKTHQTYTAGKIYKVESGHRLEWNVYYMYTANGNVYKDVTSISFTGYIHHMVNKPVMVVYSGVHPENNVPLLNLKNYKDYDIEMPDSMRWIYKIEEEKL